MTRAPFDPAALDTGREIARSELSIALFGIPGVSKSHCDDPAQRAKAADMARGLIAEAAGWISVLEGPDALAVMLLSCLRGANEEAKHQKEQNP